MSGERSRLALTALSLLALAACGGPAPATDAGDQTPDAGNADASSPPNDAGPGDGGSPTRLDTFEEDVASAQCNALFRCCDSASIEEHFAQYECIPGLPCPFEAYQDRLPPADEAECVPLMRELNALAPFAVWLDEARAGRIQLDEEAHDACLDALSTASCGEQVRAALYDPSCFGRPRGGDPYGPAAVDHAMFERVAGLGAPCVTIPDDAFGSCDPEVAFCCARLSETDPCSTGGPGEAGTCVAVGALGEPCSTFPPQPCAPGLGCPPAAGIEDPTFCAEPNTTPLANGERCHESFQPIGVCTEGYCDFETELCQPKKALGASCNAPEECASGTCTGEPGEFTCTEPTFCIGT